MVYHRIRCSPILFVIEMDLVIKEVHQNNPDNEFVLAYADDIAQMETSIDKLQELILILIKGRI